MLPETFETSLRVGYDDVPEDERPTFSGRYTQTANEARPLMEAARRRYRADQTAEGLDAQIAAIVPWLTDWRNVRDPANGDSVGFPGVDQAEKIGELLPALLRAYEIGELVVALVAENALGPLLKKVLPSPSPGGPEPSGDAADAAASD